MKPFTSHTGVVVALDRANVDTDQIIPKQFLTKVERVGFGQHCFHDWRYLDAAGTTANPDFVLNWPRYQGASVLLARENFGCGSSREHAPWALKEMGFLIVIAPSFADIFYGNAINNGMVPVKLTDAEVEQLFVEVSAQEGAQISVDLLQMTVTAPSGARFSFTLNPFHRECLIKGLDSIGWTLQHLDAITAYEAKLPAWRA